MFVHVSGCVRLCASERVGGVCVFYKWDPKTASVLRDICAREGNITYICEHQ